MLPSKATVIQANPLLATYQTMLVLWFIITGAFFVFLIGMIVTTIVLGPTSATGLLLLSHIYFYLFLFLLYCFSFVTTILQWRYWKRIEKRRLAAAQGDLSLLAAQQPSANPTALRLPYTLKLRPGKATLLWLTVMTLAFALVMAAWSTWLMNDFPFISPDRLHNFLVLFLVITAVMEILLLAIFLTPLGDQKIEVTEQGLRTRSAGQKAFVRWEEARLFAVYNTWGVWRNGSSLTYELSSPTAIARWIWIQHPNSFSLNPVGVPSGEYQQQMQALNELIVARTGLPLFDLRGESR
jgi:hypothetical protein